MLVEQRLECSEFRRGAQKSLEAQELDYYSHLLDLEFLSVNGIKAWSRNASHAIASILLTMQRADLVGRLVQGTELLSALNAVKVKFALRGANRELQGFVNGCEKGHRSPASLAQSELMEFYGLSRSFVRSRMKVETPVAMDWRSRRVNPDDPGSVLDFYRRTDSYIWELMAANHQIETLFNYEVCLDCLQSHGVTNVVDYGAGVGTFCLLAAERGFNVRHLDLESQTVEFARWRYERRGLSIDVDFVSGAHDDLPATSCIACLEVVEHLSHPIRFLDAVTRAVKPRGFLLVSESCSYVEEFASHLELNRWLGGRQFRDELVGRGFREVGMPFRIHPRLFQRL